MKIYPDKNSSPTASMSGIGGTLYRAYYSDRGKQRERNEDACSLPNSGVDEARLGSLLVLADGAGGLPGGSEASQEAVQYLQALYYAAPGPDSHADRLRQAVESVNALNRLAQRQLGEENSRLTTLVAAVIHQDQIWVANVGDSRAYLIQAAVRKIQQLTEDHSGHIRSVKAGLASEEDLASRRSGVITRAIGLQDRCQVDIYHYTWSVGDCLLLCSDGLASLRDEELATMVLENPPEIAAKEAVLRAVQVDGGDNCTALIAAWLPSLDLGSTPGPDLSDTLPSRPQGLSQPASVPVVAPVQQAPASEIHPPTPPRHKAVAWLLIGLLLGWLTAALIFLALLQSSGVIRLF